jgi:hypothetical protein
VGMNAETIELIKKSGGEADAYSKGAPGSPFDLNVRAGEEALGAGKYFDAEERFARALGLKPGDVAVMAARLNAQIGAGLYLSAAVNLRQLFEDHPEVIGVRYTGKTMPQQERLESVVTEFRQAITQAKEAKTTTPEEAALLLAYIGYQMKDPGAVRDGLEALESTANGKTDPLLPILRKVWSQDAGK